METFFSKNLHQGIVYCIDCWSTLIVILKSGWLDEIQDGPYAALDTAEAKQKIIKDLHTYIMDHDVNARHIEDFLLDILENGLISESEDEMPRIIGEHLEALMKDLQQGQTNKLQQMQQLWNQYKDVNIQTQCGHAEEQQGDSDYDDEDEGSEIEQEDEEDYDDQEEKGGKKGAMEIEVAKTEEDKTKQKELEDDGWTIVKKPEKGKKK